MKKNKISDMLTFGFALFAMFFGAGNLILPPYLGVISGSSWFISFLGFAITAVGLSLVGLIAIAYYDCDVLKFFSPLGKNFALILSFMVIMCAGPLLIVPRTGATAYEMGIKPLLGFHNYYTVTTVVIVFYTLTYFLTVRPSKVVDVIGKFLTPFLILALAIIVFSGIFFPIATPTDTTKISDVFGEGLIKGYQTMDCFVAMAVGSVLILSLNNKGYTDKKEQIKMLFKSGLIACAILGIIYSGLTYLGATVSSKYEIGIQLPQIIVNITHSLLGNTGKIVLGLVAFLACLTTSIGLTSASCEYLLIVTKGKIKYETFILFSCLFSTIVAIIGVSGIVKIGTPILAVIYPPTIVLILLTFFKDKIKNDLIYKIPVFTAITISFIQVISNKIEFFNFINIIPLSKVGFAWIIPSFIAFLIACLISKKQIS